MLAVATVVEVAEQTQHVLEGQFPKVETYPEIDTNLLYEDDNRLGVPPFHITLAIAEVGRVSENGLIYDEGLVNTIAEQIRGRGGIRGHVPPEQRGSAFPLDAVNWVGHLLKDGKLWLKGYIPPGESRADLRRKMAVKGRLGTSIFGLAVREEAGDGKWRAKNFQLDTVDLAPLSRAALKVNGGKFTVTAEMDDESNSLEEEIQPMADTTITPAPPMTVADVPQEVREQIVREAQVHADAERVEGLETQVAEMQPAASLVTELRNVLGEGADILSIVREMGTTLSALRGVLGEGADIPARVREMHQHINDLQTQAFETALDTTVAEFTADWNVTGDKAKKKVADLQKQFRRVLVIEIGQEREQMRVSEIANKLWSDEFQGLAESVRNALAGPGAIVGGQAEVEWQPTDPAEARPKAGW